MSDSNGRMEMHTYGKTATLCNCAYRLGKVAFDAIMLFVSKVQSPR